MADGSVGIAAHLLPCELEGQGASPPDLGGGGGRRRRPKKLKTKINTSISFMVHFDKYFIMALE